MAGKPSLSSPSSSPGSVYRHPPLPSPFSNTRFIFLFISILTRASLLAPAKSIY